MFEVWVIRMSRHIDLEKNVVFYGSSMLPRELFSNSDELENKFLSETFDVARSIAELKLSEDELALYQSVVITWPEEYFGETLGPEALVQKITDSCRTKSRSVHRRHTKLQ